MGGGGGRLLPGRSASDILVRNRFVVALLFTLEIEIANAEPAGAIIDAKHAAFLLVTRRDQPVVARVLLCRAVAAAIAGGDAEGPRADIGSPGIVSELARDDVARQFVEAVDQRQVDLRRREKFILASLSAGGEKAGSDRRNPKTRSFPRHCRPSAKRKS